MSAQATPPGLQGVLFDWDGTLVNSAEASFRCYVKLFEHYGIGFDRARFQSTYSPNWQFTYDAVGLPRERWAEADRRWLDLYRGEATAVMPGARQSLARLRDAGLRLGLVTSGDRSRVTRELARLELEGFFRNLTCAEDARSRKPHPEALLLALRCLELSPAAACYVGDSPEDVEMARAAGVRSVAVPGCFPNRQALLAAQPDAQAGSLAEAVDLLLRGQAGLL